MRDFLEDRWRELLLIAILGAAWVTTAVLGV